MASGPIKLGQLVNQQDMHMKIESRIGRSARTDQQIYTFITDFNNFKKLIPEDKVTDWESTSDQCSFHVDPVGKVGIRMAEKEPFSLVKITTIPELSTYNFIIWFQLKQVGTEDTRIKITVEPQVNQIIQSMIKSPLKQFVNGIIDSIETYPFD